MNVSLDFVDQEQRLYGHRTLDLLNSHEDPTFLRTVLYSHIARTYIAAPAANFVRVVINGESWGIYVSAEQFNKDFTKDRLDSFEDFINGVAGATPAPPPPSEPGQRRFRGPGPKLSLRSFAEQRRTYLLNHAEVKKAPAL